MKSNLKFDKVSCTICFKNIQLIQKCHLILLAICTHTHWFLMHIEAKGSFCIFSKCVSGLVLEVKGIPFCGINKTPFCLQLSPTFLFSIGTDIAKSYFTCDT